MLVVSDGGGDGSMACSNEVEKGNKLTENRMARKCLFIVISLKFYIVLLNKKNTVFLSYSIAK